MSVKGMVYYCPELRLYRYKADDSKNSENAIDSKFDADELEDAIVAQLVAAEKAGLKNDHQAKFLANMTGLARVNPHKIVTFDDESDKIKILDPVEYWKQHDKAREDGSR